MNEKCFGLPPFCETDGGGWLCEDFGGRFAYLAAASRQGTAELKELTNKKVIS